ncbi:restriction endonuclease subunit S [Brevibacillus borstelensis]|uniref:restriction endonuclease subunit S n=1 Tax=Brevibacillus borstelensis TaxID=45462 RepID=UPI002E1CB6AF|nr:restriction endonuclease subunit S [Brevibacillus borstelensis]MED1876060.1 restriction endonuclease subunit S [Brevibacillus borstelensis]
MSKTKDKTVEELVKVVLVPEEEQPYKVPDNWVWVKFGKVVTVNPPKINLPSIQSDDLCSFIPMAAVCEKNGVISGIEERKFIDVKSGYTQFIEDDILFAKITPCMENGKTAIAKNLKNGFGYGSTEFFVLRASNVVENRYIYYLLRSISFRKEAKQHMTGAVGQQRVPKAFIENYPLPLPPRHEQKRIADKVENLLNKINQAKELIEEAKGTYEFRRAAILEKAFRGDLTTKWREENSPGGTTNGFGEINTDNNSLYELPFGWKWTKLGLVSEVKGGKRLPKGHKLVKHNTGFPYIKAGNLKDGTVILEDIEYLEPDTHKTIKNYVVSSGDVYITIVGACIGDAGLIPPILDGANLTENAAKIFNLRECINEYLALWLRSPKGQQAIKSNILSAAQGKLALSRIKELPLPIPSIAEQKAIVDIVNNLLSIERRSFKLFQIDFPALSSSIINKAFRGELGTNNPFEDDVMKFLI